MTGLIDLAWIDRMDNIIIPMQMLGFFRLRLKPAKAMHEFFQVLFGVRIKDFASTTVSKSDNGFPTLFCIIDPLFVKDGVVCSW